MQELQRRLARVRMLICDVDGVLTDGRIWLSDSGQWRRFFHVRDGVGLKLLMEGGYRIAIISGGASEDVVQRMNFLKVDHVYLNAAEKTGPFEDVLKKTGMKESEVAFIGDEVYDVPVLKRVGFGATVPEAVAEVREAALYLTKSPGGRGAVREVADLIRHHGALSGKTA